MQVLHQPWVDRLPSMEREATIFLRKAAESLESAESEFASRRYNSCANRCYYAAFQAAVAALLGEGIRSSGDRWKHTFVHAAIAGRLINRQQIYPTEPRRTLGDLQVLRNVADYSTDSIQEIEAYRGLSQCRAFVFAIQRSLGEEQ